MATSVGSNGRADVGHKTRKLGRRPASPAAGLLAGRLPDIRWTPDADMRLMENRSFTVVGLGAEIGDLGERLGNLRPCHDDYHRDAAGLMEEMRSAAVALLLFIDEGLDTIQAVKKR